MTPLSGPSTIMGAERANAASPTMNGEPVSSSASHPSTTMSIQRAALRKSPESQSRRYACSRKISTTAGRATVTAARGATLLIRARFARCGGPWDEVLPARPLGLALLHERARTLEPVLGRAKQHGEVRLEP